MAQPASEIVLRCRALLEALTPLHGDCGLHCGCRCCASVEG